MHQHGVLTMAQRRGALELPSNRQGYLKYLWEHRGAVGNTRESWGVLSLKLHTPFGAPCLEDSRADV